MKRNLFKWHTRPKIQCKNTSVGHKVKGRNTDQFVRGSDRFEFIFSKLKLKGWIFLHIFVDLYVRSDKKFFLSKTILKIQ